MRPEEQIRELERKLAEADGRAAYWKQRAKSAEGHLRGIDAVLAGRAVHARSLKASTPWEDLTEMERTAFAQVAYAAVLAVNAQRDARKPRPETDLAHVHADIEGPTGSTDLWIMKGPDGKMYPACPISERYFERFKIGSVFKASVRMKRNGKHHRLGMMLLQAVFDNQDKYTAFEPFLNEVKILTGLTKTFITSTGQLYYMVGSISFENMDELRFREWKNDALNAVLERFIPDMAPADRDRLEHYILTVG